MTKRKDGLWQEKFRLNDGTVKYIYGKTKSEVIRKIAEIKEVRNRAPNFETVADEWFTAHELEVTYNAHKAYVKPLRIAVDAFRGSTIDSITSADIDAYIKRISAQGFAKKTVKIYLGCVSLIFNHAILKGYVKYNPCDVVSVSTKLKSSHRELPDEKNIQIIKDSVNLPFGLFAYLLLHTGCRRNEALALTYEDIDWDNHIIHIDKSIVWTPNQPELKSTKTEAGTRIVPLLDSLADKLDRKGRGIIFKQDDGYISQIGFRRRWDKYAEQSGITCTPHQLRHLFATILYEAGIDEVLATEMMGHTSTKVTHDIYTHIRMEKMKKGIESLNSYLRI